jgi:hypothetical protein
MNDINCRAWRVGRRAWGVERTSIVKSPEGTSDWIIYHATKNEGACWDRNVGM